MADLYHVDAATLATVANACECSRYYGSDRRGVVTGERLRIGSLVADLGKDDVDYFWFFEFVTECAQFVAARFDIDGCR